MIRWQVGVTTTPARRETLLPQTIKSLRTAGFDAIRLFVDGDDDSLRWWLLDCRVTCRADKVGNFGNFHLGLAELFHRDPDADRYLMFEDDIACVLGLREYLEAVPMPEGGYCNLYSGGERNCLLAENQLPGWFPSDQRAAGALGLMFDNKTVIQLLGSEVFVRHRKDYQDGIMRADGAVCLALRSDPHRRVIEYVHSPSLLQHTGAGCSQLEPIRREKGWSTRSYEGSMTSPLFPGEEFDARTLL